MIGSKTSVLVFTLLFSASCIGSAPPEMVLVDGASFGMGTDRRDTQKHALSIGLKKPWFADESPEHRVTVASFYIDRYEVTNQDYYIFSQATDHKPPPHWESWKYPEGKANLPVTNVTFFDATTYAKWAGKRLPTEAEWEYAARGPQNFLYPWGNNFDPKSANISRSATKKMGEGLQFVGSHPSGASYFGVEDMIGNAWEWVWDYYQPYPGNKFTSPDYGKKFVIVRGLSFYGLGHFSERDYKKVLALKARALYREKLSPLSRKIDVGFRCAKDIEPLSKKLYDYFNGRQG